MQTSDAVIVKVKYWKSLVRHDNQALTFARMEIR